MYIKILSPGITIFLCLIFIIGSPINTLAQDSLFTKEEQDYIAASKTIKAASLDGIAPLQYTDKNNEVQGISKRMLEEIAEMTGLAFEYKLYDSLDEAFASGADIFFGIPKNYAPPGMILSSPYLKSETILYINSAVKQNDLQDKRYAAVKGSALPEGIKKENAIYYDTREESLDAVEKGQADYGYGNAYSVAFYTLQNHYKDIVTIPKGKESREYSMGFLNNNDELLISIINKSISEIDERQINNWILDIAASVERKISLSMVMNVYGQEILAAVLVITGVLLFSIIANIRANQKLAIQNRRYEKLAEIANEYFYEYFVKGNGLQLSSKCIQLFGTEEAFNEASAILKKVLSDQEMKGQIAEIKLPLANGGIGIFKTINLSVNDEKGNLEYIIGKLVDITEEAAEKEILINKAQIDGLTGLYNPVTARELIMNRISNKNKNTVDAFILIDIDLFKNINDTYGHLTGDQVLIHVAKSLKLAFRNTDIIGRIGGDEFCVYMKEIPSLDFVQIKCQQLNSLFYNAVEDIPISVSIGVALVNEEKIYENLFGKADKALYEAKRNGKAQVVIFEELTLTK